EEGSSRVMKSYSGNEKRGRRMQHPDEGMIHTWLDGELPAEESAAMESHVATCQQCASAVAEARGFMAGASRIVSALDIVPGGVIPVAKPRQKPWYASSQFRAAAAVLVVAGASLLVVKKENPTQLVLAPVNAPLAERAATPSAQTGTTNSAATLASPEPAVEDRAQSVAPVEASSDPLAKESAATAKARQNAAEKASPVNDVARRDEVARSDQKDALTGKVGGAATGFATATAQATTKAFEQRKTSDAVKPTIATGGSGMSEPRLIRVDSAKTPRQSFYAMASGATLVLTEIEAPEFAGRGASEAAPAPARKTMGAPRNAPTTTRAMSPPSAPVPDPMIPFPVGASSQAAAKATINTITWFDATGLRRYILSGPVPVADLEAARVILQKAQQ
ncbi:MAG: zf-HC2 domain-containing protein, partial [Gemmatimonadales bacterium]